MLEAVAVAVAVALDGEALRWYQWENKRHPIRRWSDLKGYLLRQFRPINGGSLHEQWLATTQTTTVIEYRRKFIETASPLDRIPEDILLGQFINGLKEEIKTELRLLSPINLEQAMEMAVRVEEKHRVANFRKQNLGSIKTGSYSGYGKGSSSVAPSSYGGSYSSQPARSWGSNSPESQASLQSPKSVTQGSKIVGEIRRLTD